MTKDDLIFAAQAIDAMPCKNLEAMKCKANSLLWVSKHLKVLSEKEIKDIE
jgi:hypothetical protein